MDGVDLSDVKQSQKLVVSHVTLYYYYDIVLKPL